MTRIKIVPYGNSNTGLVREANEDSFYVGSSVFAVADGMGGHVAGEVASEAALEPVAALDGKDFPSTAEAAATLAEAAVMANERVFTRATTEPELAGMGTTLTAVMLTDGRLQLAHVGDSRAYLLRDGELMLLTEDHTLVAQLVKEGRITEDQAARHPQRNVITRAVGVDPTVEVDTMGDGLELRVGDQVLLCSDGLTGPVDDGMIARILAEEADGDRAIQRLLDTANARGGPDNITAVLLRVEDADAPPGAARAPAPARVDDDDATAEIAPPAFQPAPDPLTTTTIRPAAAAAAASAAASSATSEPGQVRTAPQPQPPATVTPPTFDAEELARLRGDGVDEPPVELRRSRRGRWGSIALGVVVVLAVLAAGGVVMAQRSYFVDLTDDDRVAIYQGLPVELLGLRLNRVVTATDLRREDLSALRDDRLQEGPVSFSSLEEAEAYVEVTLRPDVDDDDETGQPSGEASEGQAPQSGSNDLSPGSDAAGDTSQEETDAQAPGVIVGPDGAEQIDKAAAGTKG